MVLFAPLLLLLAHGGHVAAQWYNITSSWIGGSQTVDTLGQPPVIGVWSASNIVYPSPRFFSCMSATATGPDYQIYVYGGNGLDLTGNLAFLKDLWQFNLTSGMWKQVMESAKANGTVWIRGMESSSVYPGSTSRNTCHISPRDGNMYMFGGLTTGRNNYMWRYNTTSGLWAWLGGGMSNTPQVGVESATIYPSPRRNGKMIAASFDDVLVLMGGFGDAGSAGVGDLNDLWQFSIVRLAWTWLAGTIDRYDTPSFYYSRFAASNQNVPGSRSQHAMTVDPVDGKIYIFGGMINTVYLNDFWSLNLNDRMWIWISGGTGTNGQSISTSGLPFSLSNTPGARASATLLCLSGNNYLALYGGRGFGLGPNTVTYSLNEIWLFETEWKQWAFIAGGAGQPASYSALGVGNLTAYPPGRSSHNGLPLSNNRTLLVFGGQATTNTDYLSDLWRLDLDFDKPPTELVITTPTLASTATSIINTLATNQTSSATRNATATRSVSTSSKSLSASSIKTSAAANTSTAALPTSSSAASSSSKSSTAAVSSSDDSSTVVVDVDGTALAVNGADSTTSNSSISSPVIVTLLVVGVSIILVAGAAMIYLARQRQSTAAWKDANNREDKAIVLRTGDARSPAYADEYGLSVTNMTNMSIAPPAASSAAHGASNRLSQMTAASATKVSYDVPMELEYKFNVDVKCNKTLHADAAVRIFSAVGLTGALAQQPNGGAVQVKVFATDVKPAADKEQTGVNNSAATATMKYELRLLSAVNKKSPHVTTLLGWTAEPPALITKQYQQGVLDTWIRQHGIVSKALKLGFWTDVAMAVRFLHVDAKIAHRDIRAANIYIDLDQYGGPFCVLGGFCAAHAFSATDSLLLTDDVSDGAVVPVSPAYSAPEFLLRAKYKMFVDTMSNEFQADMYSVAVVGLELVCNRVAWPSER